MADLPIAALDGKTPLMAANGPSRCDVINFSISSGPEPGYWVTTVILGKLKSGSKLMANLESEISPNNMTPT